MNIKGWLFWSEYHSVVLGTYGAAIKELVRYLKKLEKENDPDELLVRFYRDGKGMSEHHLNKNTAHYPNGWDDLYKVAISDWDDDIETIYIDEIEIKL